ncbi:hypothetical protein Tco_0693354, partial [Tanacetum coccineum]
EFPNQDMKEEFFGWFGSQICQRHVDKDPGVSGSSKLFALACGPTSTPILVNSCVVNDMRFVVHSRDERHTTQNSGICSLDALPHDLADSDNEDLANDDDDDDDVAVVYSSEEED